MITRSNMRGNGGAVAGAAWNPLKINMLWGWDAVLSRDSLRQNSDGTTTVNNGDVVGYIPSITNNTLLTQTTHANKPTFSSTAFNGKGGIYFNGSTNSLIMSAAHAAQFRVGTADFMLIAVVDIETQTQINHNVFYQVDSTLSPVQHHVLGVTRTTYRVATIDATLEQTNTSTITTGKKIIFAGRNTAYGNGLQYIEFYRNNSLINSNTFTPVNLAMTTQVTVGHTVFDGAAYRFKGYIGAMWWYAGTLGTNGSAPYTGGSIGTKLYNYYSSWIA